jgi:hypothetical protein
VRRFLSYSNGEQPSTTTAGPAAQDPPQPTTVQILQEFAAGQQLDCSRQVVCGSRIQNSGSHDEIMMLPRSPNGRTSTIDGEYQRRYSEQLNVAMNGRMSAPFPDL